MTKQHEKEPILRRAQMLLFIFLIGILIILATNYSSRYMGNKFKEEADNKRAQEALGKELLNNLFSLEGDLNRLTTVDDQRDLALIEEKINVNFAETHEIIQILQHGGTFTKTISTNFEEKDEITFQLHYERVDQESYAVEVLELMPRILDLEDVSEKLIRAVEKKLDATDPDERLASVEEVSLLFKQAESFLQRSEESANHIYYISNLEMQTIDAKMQKSLRNIGIVSTAIVILTILAGVFLSFVSIRQITDVLKDRARAKESLQKTELHYRTVADFTYAWEYWKNPDGNYQYVSPSSERVTGYKAAYIQEHPDFLQEIIIPEDKYIWENHRHDPKQEDSVRKIRFRIQHKTGKVIWLEHTCQPVLSEEGEFLGFRGSNRDITAQMFAQNALKESEERYRALVENAPIGILLATPDGQIIAVNKTALDMLGSPSKEATQKINLLTFLPLVKGGFSGDFQEVLQKNKTKINEFVYTSKWGKTLHTRYALTAVRDASQELLGVQVLLEDITEQANYKSRLEREVKNLAAINNINATIISRPDLETMAKSVLAEISINLNTDAANLLIYDENALNLTCIAQHGFQSVGDAHKSVLRVGTSYAGEAALERKTVHLENLQDENVMEKIPARWHKESFKNYYGVPLLVKGELKGILELFHRKAVKRDQKWVRFLETLAQQTAIAIDNHFLLEALHRSNMELELAHETTLEGWARALELRDYETKGHTERVTKLTEALARELGIRGEELIHIRRGALLHDIGKIAVPDQILLKPGPCTQEEWKIIRQHPQFGYDMLKEITHLQPSLDIVLYHHEKWDGSGYPYGLAGEKIPFSARIFAIVDVWDALINDRPYHKAWDRERIVAHIMEEKGKHFDPHVVEAFERIML